MMLCQMDHLIDGKLFGHFNLPMGWDKAPGKLKLKPMNIYIFDTPKYLTNVENDGLREFAMTFFLNRFRGLNIL